LGFSVVFSGFAFFFFFFFVDLKHVCSSYKKQSRIVCVLKLGRRGATSG